MNQTISILELDSSASQKHLEEVVKIHQQEITQGFLSTLDPRFLVRLYSSITKSPYTFIIVALKQEQIIGFIVGTTDIKKFYAYFLLNYGFISVALLFRKFFSIQTLKKIIEIFSYPNKRSIIDLPKNEIINFCVTKNQQNLGIGSKLFDAVIAKFRSLGYSQVKIVTGIKQIQAQKFYEARNATLQEKIEVHSGDTSLVYVYDMIS